MTPIERDPSRLPIAVNGATQAVHDVTRVLFASEFLDWYNVDYQATAKR